MLREFCSENLRGIPEAIRAGAGRIELCDDLSVGGITPSEAVMGKAVAMAHELGARVMVMIRPRGGNFSYTEEELCAMEAAIGAARCHGADGVVFGCVREGRLDEASTLRLVHAAQGLDMTFHMAFDEVDKSLQPEVLRQLGEMGFSRVLTHGGPLSMSIDECLPHLRDLVRAAEGAIQIMPGGGVTWENVKRICDNLHVLEAHGTRIVDW